MEHILTNGWTNVSYFAFLATDNLRSRQLR